ncbi:MAG: ABC transporter ATP-binding protein [[Eubacterium] sulci]|nr:ABC transporter ATP-binding protein [[Eubacterium] sulci]
MLEVKSLCKKYNNKIAIDGVSFSVNAGEIVALIGANGAGKTTIMNSIAGIIHSTSGDIYYKERDLLKNPNLLSEFGILINATFIDYLNVEENLKLLMQASNLSRLDTKSIETVLTMVGLENVRKKKVKSFSFGMKQRLGLAQALLSDIKFLMLDEPFVGLDPLGKEIFKNTIVEMAHTEKKGVLFSSHDLKDVEDICDRIVMIKDGKVVFDDVFSKKKRILLTLNEHISGVETLKKMNVKIVNNIIIIDDVRLLGPIVNEVSKYREIIDIKIQENDLIDLFNG